MCFDSNRMAITTVMHLDQMTIITVIHSIPMTIITVIQIGDDYFCDDYFTVILTAPMI